MRVKFTEAHQYETEGRNKGPTFKAGDVEDFRDDIAERFIRRGVAVKHDSRDRPAAPAAPAPASAPKPDSRGGKPSADAAKVTNDAGKQ